VRDLTGSGGEAEQQRFIADWVNRPLDPGKKLPFRFLLLKPSITPGGAL
jgi:hypothetical protein